MTTHAPASEIAINPKTEKCQRLEAALLVAKAEIAQRDNALKHIIRTYIVDDETWDIDEAVELSYIRILSQLKLTSNVPYREAYQRGADSRDREVEQLKAQIKAMRETESGEKALLRSQLTESQARNESLIEALLETKDGARDAYSYQTVSGIVDNVLANNPDVEAYRLRDNIVKAVLTYDAHHRDAWFNKVNDARINFQAHLNEVKILDTQAKQGKEGL